LVGSRGLAFRIGRSFSAIAGSSASAGLGCCAGTPGPAQSQSHAVDRIVNRIVIRVDFIICGAPSSKRVFESRWDSLPSASLLLVSLQCDENLFEASRAVKLSWPAIADRLETDAQAISVQLVNAFEQQFVF